MHPLTSMPPCETATSSVDTRASPTPSGSAIENWRANYFLLILEISEPQNFTREDTDVTKAHCVLNSRSQLEIQPGGFLCGQSSYKGYGGVEHLVIKEIPEAEPGLGHAVIEVKAFGMTTPRRTCEEGHVGRATRPARIVGPAVDVPLSPTVVNRAEVRDCVEHCIVGLPVRKRNSG